MSDAAVIRANERCKAISGLLFNLGGGLIAASVVKAYTDKGVSIETGSWLFTSCVLIWVGWKVLGLLDSED